MRKDIIYRDDAIEAIYKEARLAGGSVAIQYADMFQDALLDLPSAQPEIIRCKDCKYWHREIHNGIEYFNFSSCDLNHYGDGHNFYCADAERRTDE